MKTKLRNMVVNNKQYVYWYDSGHGFNLFLSPKEIKNSKVKISFVFSPPPEETYTFWSFYNITALHDTMKTTIPIAKPAFIASLIAYLTYHHDTLFIKGKITNLDAVELLQEMGYSNIEPIWIKEW